MSVLVNGSPTEEFYPKRGLRQGDPLAPFLFLVVAEGLTGLVRQAVKADLLSGLTIGRDELQLCILQFADDTLFVCEDSFRNVTTLKAILRGFEVASGLKINFHKSKLAGINVHSNDLLCYTKTLNCNQMEVPFKYLGLEVGGNPQKKKFWEPVLSKLKARLSVWKGRFLSMAGRICVIKSVLTVVPLYYLSLFRAPNSVCKSITIIQRRFLWGWGKDTKPISSVSWENMCKAKEEGGLGLTDIRNFNYALLAKWRWRWLSDEGGKWKELLESKYGIDSESVQTPIKRQPWWWRDLHRVCREGEGDGWFQAEIGWKLGRGDRARFWEDVWIENTNLKMLFPRLHSLLHNQGQRVEEVGVWEGSIWRWTLSWRRDRFEWESELVTELTTLISRATVKREEPDLRVWGNEENGCFTVKSTYLCLTKSGNGPQSEVFKLLWKAKAFPNVIITVWRALLDRLSTRECLSRRGVALESTLCVLCQEKIESSQHLFMECGLAMRVWGLCFRWIDILFVQYNALKSHFESFQLIQANNKQNMVWKGIWAAIIRCIWEHRNSVVFKQEIVDAEEVFQKAQLKSWLWMKHKAQRFDYSLVDWILNPMSCIKSYK